MHQRQQVLVPIFAVVFLTCCLCNYVYSLPSIGFPNAQVELHHQHRMWGSYTPYYPVKQYLPPPPDCVITQVNILQRHGARFPTTKATGNISSAVFKLRSATTYTDPSLQFLTNYTYSLGENDSVPLGALQSREAGATTYERYANLVSHANIPFVRASSSPRCVDSADNWTQGVYLASNRRYDPPVAVILDVKLNTTLDSKMCPNCQPTDDQKYSWAKIFGTPIAQRLNEKAPGANLLPLDIPPLMSLCAFETVATDILSPFCHLFSYHEFVQYQYYDDLHKYYRTGYGEALGRVQGVGYVNELLARLTESPVRDNTQTHRTLDASPITFPLNRTIYADFSHDNQMIAIYSALGLFKQPKRLDPTHPDPNRTWMSCHLTPFSSRMVTERLYCTARRSKPQPLESNSYSSFPKSNIYVRVLVNDALQPLEFCGHDPDGLCELGAFKDSQRYATNDGDGDFEKCFQSD